MKSSAKAGPPADPPPLPIKIPSPYLDPLRKLDDLMHVLVSAERREARLERDDADDLVGHVRLDRAVLHDGDEALRLAAFDHQAGPDLFAREDRSGADGVDGHGGGGGDGHHVCQGVVGWWMGSRRILCCSGDYLSKRKV